VLQVIQSLHSCFLYDTVSFLDESRFHRLLPLLVSQLAAQPPQTLSPLFAVQQTPAADGPAADAFGDAVVSALVQMAITANNDSLWKTLNHQVLLSKACDLLVSLIFKHVITTGRFQHDYTNGLMWPVFRLPVFWLRSFYILVHADDVAAPGILCCHDQDGCMLYLDCSLVLYMGHWP